MHCFFLFFLDCEPNLNCYVCVGRDCVYANYWNGSTICHYNDKDVLDPSWMAVAAFQCNSHPGELDTITLAIPGSRIGLQDVIVTYQMKSGWIVFSCEYYYTLYYTIIIKHYNYNFLFSIFRFHCIWLRWYPCSCILQRIPPSD